MSPVTFQDLDPDLQKRIEGKSGKAFTLTTLVTSLCFPLVLMFAKDYFIDRPKETIKLTYDVNQPAVHPENVILTYIEIENIGAKSGSDSEPIVLEVEFRGKITAREWPVKLDPANVVGEENDGESKYRVRFKGFGSGAKFGLLFTTAEDLKRLPVLKHNQVLFKARSLQTLHAWPRE